ncbi:MAG: hybrid sensor histidine kinase/response regulator, partial [Rhodoferax sp.]
MSSNSAAPTDSEVVASDLGPLAWVLDELRKSLDGATKALRRFVREAQMARGTQLSELDASPLRIARQQLHQAVGALEMVGMEAPAKMLRAMEELAQKFVQHPELCSDDAANKVERASFALSEYLEGVLKGRTASSVALFPQYRAVQELVGAERIHPADLWAIEWRWAHIAMPPDVAPLDYAPALRSQMDRAVLSLVKSANVEGALRLKEICTGLAAAQSVAKTRSFWLISAAYFESMALGLVPSDGFTKRAASRVLQQYAALARGDQDISERLAQDLVFFCSLAVAGSEQDAPRVQAVRQAYALAQNKPVDYETEQFGRYDPALLALTRKRIAAVAETWSALAGGDIQRLKVASDQFVTLGEAMVKLHPESADLARAMTRAMEATARSGAAPLPTVAMEVATAVLYLEAAYEDLDPTESRLAERSAQLAKRLDRVGAGGQQEPMEAWMEELYRRVSDRQTMGSVVDELRVALGEIEKSLDQYFRDASDRAPLREVPSRLSQMRGVFSVLGLEQPSLAALRMRSSVEQLVLDTSLEPQERALIFEKLGNSLGAMGFLIDMLSYQRALAKKLFVYDEELGEFRPLMGRQRAAVDSGVAQVEPVAVPSIPVRDAAVSTQPPMAPQVAPTPLPVAPAAPPASVPVAVDDDDESELLEIFLE